MLADLPSRHAARAASERRTRHRRTRRSKPVRQPRGWTMATQDNLKTAREDIEAWNKHDLERHAKLLDEKHVFESATIPAAMVGRDAGRQLADGDFVVTRWTATGTHRGELMGVPPTQRRIVTRGCTVGVLPCADGG